MTWILIASIGGVVIALVITILGAIDTKRRVDEYLNEKL